MKIKGKCNEVLLVEYQMAQSSAQHHEHISWVVTGICWTANAFIMGAIINVPSEDKNEVSILLLSLIGLLIAFFQWKQDKYLQKVKLAKYLRCKTIEKSLGMRQHIALAVKSPRITTTTYNAIVSFIILTYLFFVCLSVVSIFSECLQNFFQIKFYVDAICVTKVTQ